MNIESLRKRTKDFLTHYLPQFTTDILKKNHNSYGLHGGLSGLVLLIEVINNTQRNSQSKVELDQIVEQLTDYVENSSTHLLTFSTGLAGFGWLMCYLAEKDILNINVEEYCEELDLILFQEMNFLNKESNFDALHGSVGIALYFLKRGKVEWTEKTLISLEEKSIYLENQIHWIRTSFDDKATRICDFGLAHGNASILYFLIKCFRKGIQIDKCRNLINGILEFYFNNIQNQKKIGSYFPSMLTESDLLKSEKKNYSRLAWCYGDLGILHTMYLAAQAIGERRRETEIIDMLIITSHRRKPSLTGISENNFCHGSSGAAIIYMNLFNQTGKSEFRNAWEFWIEEVLKQSIEMLDNNSKDNGLLNGIGGSVIALFSYTYPESNNDWLEAFFLN